VIARLNSQNVQQVSVEDAVAAAAVAGGPVTAAALIDRSAIPRPPPAAEGHKTTLEEQLTAMHNDHGPEASGDGEEDGSYLELLMQNAMSNLRRDSNDAARLGPPNL
jgi:hypothetical protein